MVEFEQAALQRQSPTRWRRVTAPDLSWSVAPKVFSYTAWEPMRVHQWSFKTRHIAAPSVPFVGSSWVLFSFPDEGNFNVNSIIGPRWRIYFYQTGTMILSPVTSNEVGTIRHGAPVTVDRYGNVPTIYANSVITYDISIRNEYGVERHSITGHKPS